MSFASALASAASMATYALAPTMELILTITREREAMKLELTSGQWIELRDVNQLTAGDKLALHASTELPMQGSQIDEFAEGRGTFTFSLGTVDEQLYGVLARIIQAWSYPYCLPKDDISRDLDTGKRTYADSLARLPLDDWNELEEATAEHMNKLRQSPKGRKTTSTTSGRSSRAKVENSRPA